MVAPATGSRNQNEALQWSWHIRSRSASTSAPSMVTSESSLSVLCTNKASRARHCWKQISRATHLTFSLLPHLTSKPGQLLLSILTPQQRYSNTESKFPQCPRPFYSSNSTSEQKTNNAIQPGRPVR